MSDLTIVPEKDRATYLKSYTRELGSGWFWCHSVSGWHVFYINALWGVLVDGRYLSHTGFDGFIGPLEVPEEISKMEAQP